MLFFMLGVLNLALGVFGLFWGLYQIMLMVRRLSVVEPVPIFVLALSPANFIIASQVFSRVG